MKPLYKPAHTPGPWTASAKLTASENHKGFNLWARSLWLGELSPVGDSEGNASKEGEANARLIAAAPELLEALERFVSAELAFLASVKPGVIDDHLSDAYKLALAAIRKAKGE